MDSQNEFDTAIQEILTQRPLYQHIINELYLADREDKKRGPIKTVNSSQTLFSRFARRVAEKYGTSWEETHDAIYGLTAVGLIWGRKEHLYHPGGMYSSKVDFFLELRELGETFVTIKE